MCSSTLCYVLDLFLQQEGKTETGTVSHQDFTAKKGEHYPATKPKDSDLLHGDGLFTAETHAGTEFTPKIGERYDAKRLTESDIWEVQVYVF
ncbi:unnamed protein product [Gongylonema pulchrum]|uniref:Protein kinase domain-containing protein n=1 Tax=Gongylonema pulchrum TaxID=637853 RepID=A0A183DKK1_9BILA|nr:unnamed protein product [Gongylonema pulchrum]